MVHARSWPGIGQESAKLKTIVGLPWADFLATCMCTHAQLYMCKRYAYPREPGEVQDKPRQRTGQSVDAYANQFQIALHACAADRS